MDEGIPLLCSRLLVPNMSTISGTYAIVDLLRLCSCKEFFVSDMANLIVLLKNKGITLKILLRGLEGCSVRKNSFWNFNIWSIPNDFV
jgi:hypothetical protein